MTKNFITLLLISSVFTLWQCDQGLSPEGENEQITGIQGTIFFQNWPTRDSLFDLRLVAFKNFPPENILAEILSQQAYAWPPITVDTTLIPYYSDQFNFEFELPAGKYGYLAVAQRYGPNILTDWRAVGQYDTNPDSLPSSFEVRAGTLSRNLFIAVDFKKLPIQPF